MKAYGKKASESAIVGWLIAAWLIWLVAMLSTLSHDLTRVGAQSCGRA